MVGGDARAVEAGAWIAKNATQYNFLNHSDMKDFVGDMNACKSDECFRNTWTAKYGDTSYDQLSQDNLTDALETVGPIRAKDLLGQIQAGLSVLGELQCPTTVCDSYKFTLIDRALTARATLEQTYQQGTGILLGGLMAPVGVVAGAVKEAAAAVEASGAEKAYAYWLEVRGAKATTTPRTPLAGPTENWTTFVNAEKQIQLEGSAAQRVDAVINETLSGKKDFTSSMTLTTDEALSAAQKYLGPEYREIGKPGSGVFHSADGTKEFRIDSGSISGAHAPGVPHVHFGVKDPVSGKYITNKHVPYTD